MVLARLVTRTRLLILVAGACGWANHDARGQGIDLPPQGQLLKRTYVSSIDDAAIDYALWLPPKYDAEKVSSGRSWIQCSPQ